MDECSMDTLHILVRGSACNEDGLNLEQVLEFLFGGNANEVRRDVPIETDVANDKDERTCFALFL